MSSNKFSLMGKVAIVTGGRRGIGKAIALTFADAGADVIVADYVVEDGELASVAEEIKGFGRRCIAIQTDITKRVDIDNLVRSVVNEFGRIDILVNNAGISIKSSLLDMSDDDWDMVMNTNLKGYYLCCQAVGRKMTEQKKGNIINIASVRGFRVGVTSPGWTKTGPLSFIATRADEAIWRIEN